jgi:hypothetical protein
MLRAVILTGLLVALCAPPALAASGNGLYEPYPSAVSHLAADSYYAKLGLRVSETALVRGRFAGGWAASAAGGPSERAGVGAGGLGGWELAAGVGLALFAAGVAVGRGRPASRRAGAS